MANVHLVTGHMGEVHIASADEGSLNVAIFGYGKYVLNRGSKFAATVVSSNTIRIADGDIILQGRHVRLEEGHTTDLSIQNGQQGYNRNDMIVCRYTKATDGKEECNLVVIKGTATTGTASDPAYNNGDIVTNHDSICDMPLYRIPITGISVGTPVALFSTVTVSFDDIHSSLNSKVPISRTIADVNLGNNISKQAMLNALLSGKLVIPYPNSELIGSSLPAAGTAGRIFFKKV